MIKKLIITSILTGALFICVYAQDAYHSLTINASLVDWVKPAFKPEGRLYVFLTRNASGQPADKAWPQGNNYLFARGYSSWNSDESLVIHDMEGWSSWGLNENPSFDSIPEGKYYLQLLWQQNFDGFANQEYGNLRSEKIEVVLNESQSLNVQLTWAYEPEVFTKDLHPNIKMVKLKGDTLSKWWGKTVFEWAAVLLPSGYYEYPDKEYPIYYYVGGGDSDCLSAVMDMKYWKQFADWWMQEDAPQIIMVYLDGKQNRNIYHLDSDNLGPHGYSLVNELIPYIEKEYRGTQASKTRFIGGCSTGGYGSLALQLFYPETFNGVFSYSPDPVSFTEFTTINIYEDENMFFNASGEPNLASQPAQFNNLSWKKWEEFENVLSPSGTYIESDQALGIWANIFGPKGSKGQPVPLIEPVTGAINKAVAESWSRYDLSKYIVDNWQDIGSSLEGKIYISCNTQDNHYLDRAVRVFEEAISKLENPAPRATIEWAPGTGHCSEYVPWKVFELIENRIQKLE